MADFDFIEGWYNSNRRHSALDYLPPLQVRPRSAGPDAGEAKTTAPSWLRWSTREEQIYHALID